jgi:hypothetical protein
MLSTRANPLSAIVVVFSGITVVFIGRGMRAAGRLLGVVRPPQPPWIPWLVPVTFVVGPLVSAIGALRLFGV